MNVKTNKEILLEIIEHSRFGFMAEFFVIDALRKFADKVAASDPVKDYPTSNYLTVAPEAWIGVAKEIQKKLNAEYAPKKVKRAKK